jgi:hypothetical protein
LVNRNTLPSRQAAKPSIEPRRRILVVVAKEVSRQNWDRHNFDVADVGASPPNGASQHDVHTISSSTSFFAVGKTSLIGSRVLSE